jgi:AcrR family transcriptional regulator
MSVHEHGRRVRDAEATTATILAAARRRFAADGYDRATIRAIAAEAAVDPALVMRYFGSKAQLFAAAAEFDLGLPDLSRLRVDEVGRRLAGHLFDRWESGATLVALMRAAATNEVAADRMRTIFADQLRPVVRSLCPDPEEASMRAGLVASQALGFVWCRYVLRLPPVAGLGRAEVVDWLGPTFQRYLAGPS